MPRLSDGEGDAFGFWARVTNAKSKTKTKEQRVREVFIKSLSEKLIADTSNAQLMTF